MEKKRVKSVLLLALFVVLLILFLIWIFNPEKTGEATAIIPEQLIQTISFAPAGSEMFFEVKVAGIKDLTLKFKDAVKNMILTITYPTKIDWFEGSAYSTFEISSESASAVENLKFTLKLKEEDLLNQGFELGKIKLYQESGALATNLLKVEEGYVYYRVQSKSFGTFVIGTDGKILKQ